MLDSRRLRIFCEVARQGSFSAAASALGYTQPAVSRQIATLEAEVGATLIRRIPAGAALTDAGRLLASRGQAILARLDEAEAELRALAGLEGGSLRMATFPSAAAAIVPEAVARFRKLHPRVELEIEMGDPDETVAPLRAGKLDLALSHSRVEDFVGGLGAGELDHVHLFDDPMYVALPASHRLAARPRLELRDLAGEPWMLASPQTCPDSRLFLRACHEAGFEPEIAFHNDDYTAILGFVAAEVGVAMIPDMVVRTLPRGIVVRVLSPPPPPRPIFAVLPAGYRSAPARAMLDILAEVSARWVSDRAPLPAALSA